MRVVLDGSDVRYAGSDASLVDFFTEVHSVRLVDSHSICAASKRLFEDTSQAEESGPELIQPFTQKEVSLRLGRMSNSAPGRDRLEYRHIKMADGAFRVTLAIFNRCLREGRVPSSWKSATTVLLHKRDDPADPANFRPIALQSCLYKLTMAILADRLTRWALGNGLISNAQKSARPGEGCYEHSFLMSSAVGDARRNSKKLHIAWLDLRNAFGSMLSIVKQKPEQTENFSLKESLL